MQKLMDYVKNKSVLLLLLILVFSFMTKAWRIDQPDEYYFDEIYYGFTAGQYAKGNMDAWVFDTTPPEGFSYTWDHPPTGKLLMSLPIRLLGDTSLARRVAPLIFGTSLTVLVYYFSVTLFPEKKEVALLAAFLVSLDGLILSMSRIALVGIMVTAFVLLSATFLWKRKIFLSALFFGLAVSTKWTGIFLLPLFFLFQLLMSGWDKKELVASLQKFVSEALIFIVVGVVVYLMSYSPMIQHFGWDKFVELQRNMFSFHSNLEETHPSQSKPLTWPLDIKPVWFWVDYNFDTVANIYAMGNPLLFWGGVVSVILVSIATYKTRSKKGIYLLACYFLLWVPWIFASRILFLYHYLHAVPFLALCTSLVLERLTVFFKERGTLIVGAYILLVFIAFVYFYPHWTGIPVSPGLSSSYYWLSSWK